MLNQIRNYSAKTICFFILTFLLPFTVLSQINENFSDGDFTNNPTWVGDAGQFQINSSYQLQLNSLDAGESYLSTENYLINETEWRFWIKLSFSPSVNNNTRIYLVSDNSNLKEPLNGYFLQLGEAGSDDAIELFKQTGDEITSVCRGTDGLISGSFEIMVKVIRNNIGLWEVYADPSGGTGFQLEASGTDNSINSTNYFGVLCKYTGSNSNKMYFDDFYTGPIIVDTIPPEVSTINVISENSLDIIFSESVDLASSETLSNYVVNNGIGNPEQAIREENNSSLVHLSFLNNFDIGIIYLLTVTNVKDLSENAITSASQTFVYYFSTPYDIVINEIMVDPNPQVSLPEYEYIELFNNTGFPLNLKDWTITIGSSINTFPEISIEANDYLILAKDAAEHELSNYGRFVGFSSFSLTNSGQTIILQNKEGETISLVSYSDEWYKNPEKEDGGWSLEQIDPLSPCIESDNWKASNDQEGGTPGKVNSVNAVNNFPPHISRIICIDSLTFQLFFSQLMDGSSLNNLQAFNVDKGIGNPVNVIPVDPDYKSVILEFPIPLQKGIIYTLIITDTLTNCIGQFLPVNSNLLLGVPETAVSNDIAINEILFNPKGGGVDYVEIYNRSNKIIDLKELTISSVKTTHPNPPDTITKEISAKGFLVFPENYLVLSNNPDIVKQQYYTSNPDGFIKIESLPAFNNDKGTIIFSDKSKNVIDVFSYNEEMQYPLLNYLDGVALERINYNRPTQDKTNWHSAAENVDFGTPAYKNSQFVEMENIENQIMISPDIFSPDADGYNDVLNINYEFNEPGYNANITIYDSRGRLIKCLIKNELLGTKGAFSWDGITKNNQKANIGIYIIYIEVFDMNGNVKHYKKTGVLGSRL